MKVLHVISDRNLGGAGVLLCNLLRNFDPTRVQSTVALPKDSALIQRLADIGVPVVELQNDPDRAHPASIKEITNLIGSLAPNVIHANAALSARIAGRRCGVRVVHTRHCCFPLSGIWRFSPVRWLGGVWNCRLSDRVIATADAAAADLVRLGIPTERIEVVINGSEPVRELTEAELADYRKRWSIGKDDFTVGICARLVACKGHETFLRAAKAVMEKLPRQGFVFLIAGNGERKDVLEEMAESLGIADHVRFLGFLSDPAPFYRLLRVNVNCSSGTETSCLALSEGMSAGVPAVVSDYGGNASMIGDSLAGIVYPVGDAEALADAICRIANDPMLEARMKQAAYSRYCEHYTATQMAERVMQLYESL